VPGPWVPNPPGAKMLTIEEDLKNLVRLWTVDKKVFELKQTRRDLPQRIQALRDTIGREQAAAEKLRAEITKAEAQVVESQDTAVTEAAALEDSGRRLGAITTNREYDAVHLEIAAHKKNIDTAQARVLHLQQVIENLRKEAEEAEATHQQVRGEIEPELETLTAELGGIEDRIATEAKKGDEPRAAIGKKTLSVYDRTVQRRGTPHVIALVSHAHKACDICSRNQTSQRVIEVAKKKQLLLCEGCGSLLVWREDDVPALHPQDS
jgi:predicted  nucleic acid-binding Zn-ribbon protein